MTCSNPKVMRLHEKAIEILIRTECDNHQAVDSILHLVNKVQKIDPNYMEILDTKIGALFRIKDGKEILNTIDNLLDSYPEILTLKLQKASFLKLEGRKKEALELVNQLIPVYETLFEEDSTDLNLIISYLEALEIKKDYVGYQEKLSRFKTLNLTKEKKIILDRLEKKQNFKLMEDYWNNRIDCHELINNIDKLYPM